MATKKIREVKLTKQELNAPDEFSVLNARLMNWVLDHKLIFGGIIAIIIIIAAIFGGIKYYGHLQENTASQLTAEAINTYATVAATDISTAYTQASQDFGAIIAKYGKTKNGNYARVIFANVAYQARRYSVAVENYQAALPMYKHDAIITGGILSGIAYSYAAMGQLKDATDAFEKVASNTNGALQDDALYNLGQLYARRGLANESRAAYDRIVTNHPESPFAEIIKAGN